MLVSVAICSSPRASQQLNQWLSLLTRKHNMTAFGTAHFLILMQAPVPRARSLSGSRGQWGAVLLFCNASPPSRWPLLGPFCWPISFSNVLRGLWCIVSRLLAFRTTLRRDERISRLLRLYTCSLRETPRHFLNGTDNTADCKAVTFHLEKKKKRKSRPLWANQGSFTVYYN